jgi:hypothetical protein
LAGNLAQVSPRAARFSQNNFRFLIAGQFQETAVALARLASDFLAICAQSVCNLG